MAKELADSENAARDPRLFGITERPPLGPDGMPLAWRFQYGIGLITALTQDAVAQVIDQASAEATTATDSSVEATASATRTWRFDWQMASNRPAQEPL